MLRWRLLLGVIFGAVIVGLLWLDAHASTPGIVLLPLALVVAALGAEEAASLARYSGSQVSKPLVIGGSLLVVLASSARIWPNWFPNSDAVGPLGWPLVAFAIAMIVAIAWEIVRYQGPGGVADRLARTIFSIAYVGVLLSFAVALRMLAVESPIIGRNSGGLTEQFFHSANDQSAQASVVDPSLGLWALASMVLVVKMADIGAYTFGRLIGRHKLHPKLSPGKTWEGLAGGFLFACVASYFFFHYAPIVPDSASGINFPGGMFDWLVYGIAMTLAGLFGDLVESALKRDAGRKDSSDWMPGFGGVLDLLDSLLVAAPAAFLFWNLATFAYM